MTTMGSTLQQRENRFSSQYDEKTHTWRLLDTWHSSLKNVNIEDEIEDDHPALTILPEAAFIDLVKTATRMGILENAMIASNSEEVERLTEKNSSYKAEIENLQKMLLAKPKTPEAPPMTESFALKKHAMDNILKVLAIDSMEN